MRVAPETAEEELHLLVHHRVLGHGVDESPFLACVGHIAVQQQVAGFEEVAVHGQLLNREAAIQQLALVTVNIGDGRVA
jgi:hypothetical protein